MEMDVVASAIAPVVGERRVGSEALPKGQGGAYGSENAGMSSNNPVRIRITECLRFPKQCSSTSG